VKTVPKDADKNINYYNSQSFDGNEKRPLLGDNKEALILNDYITYLSKFRQRSNDRMI
jgi:hypothetical protein